MTRFQKNPFSANAENERFGEIHKKKAALKLSKPSKGENIIVMTSMDEGLFRNTVEPTPGVV